MTNGRGAGTAAVEVRDEADMVETVEVDKYSGMECELGGGEWRIDSAKSGGFYGSKIRQFPRVCLVFPGWATRGSRIAAGAHGPTHA